MDERTADGESREHLIQRQQEEAASEERDYFEHFDIPFAQGGNNYSPQEIDALYGRINYESISPPRMALTFRFANTGTQPVTFTISDVNSTLGNFAPRPETLTVTPGQAGTLDPMLSNLNANFEELDVTLTLKIGRNKETQILRLRRSQEPAVAPGRN